MSDIERFLNLVRLFSTSAKLAEPTLSTRIFNDGKRITSLREGRSDIGVRRLAKAVQWLSDHWPSEAEWPEAIERPKPSAPVAAEASAEGAAP